ncbi:hypothetical protein V6N12_025637 [Hibiscus sabdariffa]|uniref:RNase H type-1 domain-containing protein n=1 Tax=Hibiscus sabdariffa TaxID=183260 RepID=A0ABR2CJC1_9ROSI
MVWAQHYSTVFQADYMTLSRWITLNTDGALFHSSSIGSAGGLLCDHEGSWLLGFNKHLGISSIMEVEFWGIIEGLRLV